MKIIIDDKIIATDAIVWVGAVAEHSDTPTFTIHCIGGIDLEIGVAFDRFITDEERSIKPPWQETGGRSYAYFPSDAYKKWAEPIQKRRIAGVKRLREEFLKVWEPEQRFLTIK